MSTLVSTEILRQNCEAEGIDFSKVSVISPRWAESSSKLPKAKSALVHCDAIIRDDGSAVLLDGCMSWDGRGVVKEHIEHGPVSAEEWEQYVANLTLLPA